LPSERDRAARAPWRSIGRSCQPGRRHRRLANFVEFIGERRGSDALAKALVETQRRVDQLSGETEALRRSREKIFQPPPIEWIKNRLNNIQQVLEQRIAGSAQMFRALLGPIRLERGRLDIGRVFSPPVATRGSLPS
jgi:hypothetical protein